MAANALFALSWDIFPNDSLSTSHLLLPSLPPPSNCTTPDHLPSPSYLLSSLLPLLGNFTALFALSRNVFLNYVPRPDPFPPLLPLLGNFIAFFALGWDVSLDHPLSPGLFLSLLLLGNSTTDQWTSCSACLSRIISAESWRREIYCLSEKKFLDGMFLLGTMKYLSLYICNNYLHLLASKLYIMDALLADLRSWIDLL